MWNEVRHFEVRNVMLRERPPRRIWMWAGVEVGLANNELPLFLHNHNIKGIHLQYSIMISAIC
jgi:hypothetical protein